MKRLFLWISILMLLTACGQVKTPTPVPVTPTRRILPSPDPAIVMTRFSPTPTPIPTTIANADVTYVRAVQAADGSWTFHVTVSHPDTRWDDYANGWDILLPDGSKLLVHEGDEFTRLLAHPHVDEQPFTRSQSAIIIPENVPRVIVRAHDVVTGFGGKEIMIDLEKDSGDEFDIDR
jgi:hypothetical protein